MPNTNYQLLELKMPKYSDLKKVAVIESDEKFKYLRSEEILHGYMTKSNDMATVLSSKILVRNTVYEMLIKAQSDLSNINSNFKLYVTYGYRTLEIQEKRFNKIKSDLQKTNENITDEDVHRFIAVPQVAGHPTGGAIDITIFDISKNNFLDFGSELYNYSNKKCYVFDPNITNAQKGNRMMLRKVMLDAGFAPFDGEWWHFSYGDKEWAYYYKKKFAIYDQKVYKEVQI